MVLAQKKKAHATGQNPEIKPGTYGKLIYDKETRIHNRENTVYSLSSAGKTGQLNEKE